ncbi:MAG: hypothetical protein GF383_06205 [Candidatus Lokiarchaeota archaeon]|nr:hypothetical protein [Candidatus Lokiarchaeota archaeon]
MNETPNIKDLKDKIDFGIKIWLEIKKNDETKNILGSGWAQLLERINENTEGSLTKAAKECGYSYKYAWNILKRIEKRSGFSPVITGKGGRGGGGWVKLNDWGLYLLKTYKNLVRELKEIENKLEKNFKID